MSNLLNILSLGAGVQSSAFDSAAGGSADRRVRAPQAAGLIDAGLSRTEYLHRLVAAERVIAGAGGVVHRLEASVADVLAAMRELNQPNTPQGRAAASWMLTPARSALSLFLRAVRVSPTNIADSVPVM